MDFGDDPSVHRLMEFLKIAFHPRHVDDVEEMLLAKEKKLKDEADLLKEENGRLRSDKLGVEAKLTELIARVNGDTTVIQDRERKLMEEVHKGKVEVTELRTKIIELENNNSIAEAAAARWKNRFEDLEPRISQLEKDVELLRQGSESPISKNIKGGLDANCTLPESGNANSVHVKTEADVFDCNENPCQIGASTRHFITTEKDNPRDAGIKGHARSVFVEISDSDDDECEKQESCERSPQNSHSNEDGMKRVGFTLKRKQDPQCEEENAPSSKRTCLQEMRCCENQTSVGRGRAPQSHTSELVFGGDSEDSDSYSDTDSVNEYIAGVKSCGKWKDQMEMWLALHKDPQLCMDAVCALYRQKNLTSSKHQDLILEADAVRITELAEFLIGDDGGNGKRRKSMEELMEHDKNGIQDCRKIASSVMYSEQLFHIFNNPHSP